MTHVGTFAERRDTERVKSKFLLVLVDKFAVHRCRDTERGDIISDKFNGGEEIAPRDDASFIGFVNPRKIPRVHHPTWR